MTTSALDYLAARKIRLIMRFAFLVLALAFAPIAPAQRVEEQVRAEVRRYVETVNRLDAEAVAALYLNDPRTSTIGDGEINRGWQRVAALLTEVFAQDVTLRMTSDSVHVFRLGNDAAVAILRYRWDWGFRAVTGAMTLVYTRTRQGWRVVHDHTSTLSSSVPPAAIADSGPNTPRRPTILCTVTRIVDGDTIDCAGSGRVRLIGMDTPEDNQPPFGTQATRALSGMISVGAEVQLEPDVEDRDRYGRLLRYVWVGRTMINWRLVREGWAVVLTYPPNVQYVEAFAEAQRRARDEGLGLWAIGGFECLPRDRRAKRCD